MLTKHMELMKLKTNTNNRRNVMDKFIKAMELLTVLILGQPKRKRGRPRKKGVFK